MGERLTVGVVGLGSIARKAHLPVLAAHPGVEVIGLASRSGAQVPELEAQYRFRLQARTFGEILSVKPRGVYVLSATEAHSQQAVALLEAGICVYLEKPLANDLDDARRIVQAVERTGGLLMVGFNRRYAPAYRRALALFEGRRIELLQVHKHRNGDHSGWSLRQVVMDDTIHIIDLARFFAGGELGVVGAHARGGLVAAQLAGPSGVLVQLSQSYGAGAASERVELHGDGLTVIVEEMERLRIREKGVERVEGVGASWTATLEKRGIALATEHFLACLREGRQPEMTAAEAFRTQELAEAILLG